MGELLICHGPAAEIPYYLEGAGINIFSMEELCYYIQNNTYLLDASFMTEELCVWVDKQMGFHALSKRLLDLIQEGSALLAFVSAILESTFYCTRKEVQEILWIIRQMEEKSDFECSKIRADKLMEQEKYLGAIYEYKRLLDSKEFKEAGDELCGNIWHNLGTAYARLFLFAEACRCFEQAYMLNQTGESLRECMMCFLCMHDEDGFLKKAAAYHLDDMGMQEIKNELSIAGRSENLKELGENLTRDDIIFRWKEEYRRSCRV